MTIKTGVLVAPPSLSDWDITHLVCCEHGYEYENGERVSLSAFCGREVAGDPVADGNVATCLPCGSQAQRRECPEYGICPYLTQRQVP